MGEGFILVIPAKAEIQAEIQIVGVGQTFPREHFLDSCFRRKDGWMALKPSAVP
jgi:hypothetical protein